MQDKVNTYYFTYGTEGHPYTGGWTEVYARTKEEAILLFNLFHPPLVDGIIRCAEIYDEETFCETEMYYNGCFGEYTREAIALSHTTYE